MDIVRLKSRLNQILGEESLDFVVTTKQGKIHSYLPSTGELTLISGRGFEHLILPINHLTSMPLSPGSEIILSGSYETLPDHRIKFVSLDKFCELVSLLKPEEVEAVISDGTDILDMFVDSDGPQSIPEHNTSPDLPRDAHAPPHQQALPDTAIAPALRDDGHAGDALDPHPTNSVDDIPANITPPQPDIAIEQPAAVETVHTSNHPIAEVPLPDPINTQAHTVTVPKPTMVLRRPGLMGASRPSVPPAIGQSEVISGPASPPSATTPAPINRRRGGIPTDTDESPPVADTNIAVITPEPRPEVAVVPAVDVHPALLLDPPMTAEELALCEAMAMETADRLIAAFDKQGLIPKGYKPKVSIIFGPGGNRMIAGVNDEPLNKEIAKYQREHSSFTEPGLGSFYLRDTDEGKQVYLFPDE
jgi:hypothetical protein